MASIDDISTTTVPPQRAKALNYLLEVNHERYAMLVHGALHSHLAHILGSAYLLGGSTDHLKDVFDTVTADLELWTPAPVSINGDEELVVHLGDKTYQRAFLEYFDGRLQDFHGDWKKLSLYYLLDCNKPLLSGTIGGFGHPLIHFADAFELESPQLAVEALALTAVDYNPLHIVLDALAEQTESSAIFPALEVLQRVAGDTRFDDLLQKPGVGNTMAILQSPTARSAVVEHVKSFNTSVDTPAQATAIAQQLTSVAVLLLVATYEPEDGKGHAFDFYLTHQLTFCWCLYILIPALPAEAATMLLREVWLLMVLTYVTELRPGINPTKLPESDLTQYATLKEWKRLIDVALNATKGQGMDPHYVKVIRTLREFALIQPDHESMYLNACIAFERDFIGWSGLN